MTMDFNGGAVEVVILKGGKRYDIKHPIVGCLFRSVASVTTLLKSGFTSQVSVEITPSFQDGMTILKSGLLGTGLSSKGQAPPDKQGAGTAAITPTTLGGEKPTAAGAPSAAVVGANAFSPNAMPYLMVRFSYPGQKDNAGFPMQTPWFGGRMKGPELSFGDDGISITLKASGSTTMLATLEGASVYKDLPAIDVIKGLASVIKTSIIIGSDDATTTEVLNQKISGSLSGSKMDDIRAILYSLDCFYDDYPAEDKGGGSNQIRIVSRKSLTKGKAEFTFVMYRQIDPENNIIPMLSFSLDSYQSMFSPGQVFGTLQEVIDTSAKTIETVSFTSDDDEALSASGTDTDTGVIAEDDGSATEVDDVVGVTDKSDPKLSGSHVPGIKKGSESTVEKGKAAVVQSAVSQLRYSFTVPGLPRLRPNTVSEVVIEDNIPGISGPGLIASVEHKYDSGGWVSEVKFFRQDSVASAENRAKMVAKKAAMTAPKKKSAGAMKTPINIG